MSRPAHFVKPILENVVINGSAPRITLVRLSKKISVSNEIVEILKWKKPDMLVSAINAEHATEKVLFMIELSTAVYTKDHELQRFDNYIPLFYLDLIHVKISPSKKRSPGPIGGDIGFDVDLPPALVYKKMQKIVYRYEWEMLNEQMVKVNDSYISCPPKILEFEKLLKRGISNLC